MAVTATTAAARRAAVAAQYRKFIGRNHYSQALRNYCVTKYKDGKYYSDCSSSVSYAYKQAGEGFGILNTVGMWTSTKMKDVPVVIKSGMIQNPEVLKIGDMLLFAGNDTSRKAYGYVGHVEMVGEISGSKIMLYGHGSGLAKSHEMNAYLKSRRNTKSSTPLGNRGLIRVRRAIWDEAGDGDIAPTAGSTVEGNVIRKGDTGAAVEAMQRLLLRRDPGCLPKYGADGDFGDETEAAVKALQIYAGLPESGAFDDRTAGALAAILAGKHIEATAFVNVRDAPGVETGRIVGTLKPGERLPWLGHDSADGWHAVRHGDGVSWVSGRYSKVAD